MEFRASRCGPLSSPARRAKPKRSIDELVKFVEDFGFDMMGVFPYIRRARHADGPAGGPNPDEMKRERS